MHITLTNHNYLYYKYILSYLQFLALPDFAQLEKRVLPMKWNFNQTRKSPLPVFCVVILLSIGFTNLSSAQTLQRIEIPSSPNPVGSGARALGMGGAFIAIADDATAASWNPGGLIQLETPEISVVGTYFNRTEDNNLCTNPEASCDQSVSGSSINYLSAAYPFTLWEHNMIVSLNSMSLT